MPRFLRFLFIFYVPDLSICSSITRLSLSLSISLSFLSFFLHFVAMHESIPPSTWRRGWNLLFRAWIRKRENAVQSDNISIDTNRNDVLRCLVVPRHLNVMRRTIGKISISLKCLKNISSSRGGVSKLSEFLFRFDIVNLSFKIDGFCIIKNCWIKIIRQYCM